MHPSYSIQTTSVFHQSYTIFNIAVAVLTILSGCSPSLKSALSAAEPTRLQDSSMIFHRLAKSESHIWALDYGGGALYKSIDGIQWQHTSSFDFSYGEVIQFTESGVGYVCGDFGYVYRSQDEGQTWREISPDVESRLKKPTHKDTLPNENLITFHSMQFDDKGVGFLAGFMYNPSLGVKESYSQLYFKTGDNGESWSRMNRSDALDFLDSMSESLTPKKNKEVINRYYLDDHLSFKLTKNKQRQYVILKTGDSSRGVDTTLLSTPSSEKYVLRKILFINQNQGIIVGGTMDEEEKSVIYLTTDQGESWSLFENDWPHVHDVVLLDNHMLVSCKNGLLLRIPLIGFS